MGDSVTRWAEAYQILQLRFSRLPASDGIRVMTLDDIFAVKFQLEPTSLAFVLIARFALKGKGLISSSRKDCSVL